MLVPPITTAAMTCSSRPVPVLVCTEPASQVDHGRYPDEDIDQHEGQKAGALYGNRRSGPPAGSADGEDVASPGRVAAHGLHHHKEDEEQSTGSLAQEPNRPANTGLVRDAGDPGPPVTSRITPRSA